MGTLTTHHVIVVAAGAKGAAKALARVINDQNGGAFEIGLSPTGVAPATHWWAGVGLTDAHKIAIEAQRTKLGLKPEDARLFESAKFTPEQVLATCGLRRIELPLPWLPKL